jgi:DNA polymerase-3 subunit gamma/tau
MSYLVLARKYRPQTFSDVYAQNQITKILKNSIEMNRIGQAYLFTGPRGVGKTSMARIFAKSLNCIHGPTISPCNVCENCLEITKGISSDVVEIDGASNTGVDDIRDLQKELLYSSVKGKYKIYIIDEVHMLSKHAFNALLKTLEEPPENVIFIFATTEPHKVLPTIVSRCQRFDFKRFPTETIVSRLKYICQKENIEADDDSLYLIAKKADGGMRDALSLLDQVIAFMDKKIIYEDVLNLFGVVKNETYLSIFKAITEHNPKNVIEAVHKVLENGNDIQEFISGMLEFARLILLVKIGLDSPEISKNLKIAIIDLANKFEENSLMLIMSILIKTKSDLKLSENPILLTEITFIKLTNLSNLRPIEDILRNLKNTQNQFLAHQKTNKVKDVKFDSFLYKNKQNQATKLNSNLHKKIKNTAVESQINIINQVDLESENYPKELDRNLVEKNWQNIIEKIKNVKTIVSVYVERNTKIENVSKKQIELSTNSELALQQIKNSQALIEDILSKHFGFPIHILIKYIKEKKKTEKVKISLHNIREKSPDLADFIDITNSLIIQK